jgi:hypothetical protein
MNLMSCACREQNVGQQYLSNYSVKPNRAQNIYWFSRYLPSVYLPVNTNHIAKTKRNGAAPLTFIPVIQKFPLSYIYCIQVVKKNYENYLYTGFM